MKKILTLVAMFVTLIGYSQKDCYIKAVGFSYLVPKGASAEIIVSGKFQGGIGLFYTAFTKVEKTKFEETFDLDILAYGGVRVFHQPYKTAIYTNIGYLMGFVRGPRLFTSAKLMFLRDQRSFSIEPYYADKLGLKLTYYIKL